MIDTVELREVFTDCLFREGEAHDDAVIVEGLVDTFGLHPERLESKREQVAGWLDQLPLQFKASDGGGWSTLNAVMLEDGTQWGEQRNMQELVVLAIGLELGSFPLPRDMWSVLPGGMPYFIIKDTL